MSRDILEIRNFDFLPKTQLNFVILSKILTTMFAKQIVQSRHNIQEVYAN